MERLQRTKTSREAGNGRHDKGSLIPALKHDVVGEDLTNGTENLKGIKAARGMEAAEKQSYNVLLKSSLQLQIHRITVQDSFLS